MEKKYEFEEPKGRVSLLELLDTGRQLIVCRAFFEPGGSAGSMIADHLGDVAHLKARDTTIVHDSSAPLADIAHPERAGGLTVGAFLYCL